jgi:hypothetical protein
METQEDAPPSYVDIVGAQGAFNNQEYPKSCPVQPEAQSGIQMQHTANKLKKTCDRPWLWLSIFISILILIIVVIPTSIVLSKQGKVEFSFYMY